jgi:hypothetical protein
VGPVEEASLSPDPDLEDENRMQSPKRRVLNKR